MIQQKPIRTRTMNCFPTFFPVFLLGVYFPRENHAQILLCPSTWPTPLFIDITRGIILRGEAWGISGSMQSNYS